MPQRLDDPPSQVEEEGEGEEGEGEVCINRLSYDCR